MSAVPDPMTAHLSFSPDQTRCARELIARGDHTFALPEAGAGFQFREVIFSVRRCVALAPVVGPVKIYAWRVALAVSSSRWIAGPAELVDPYPGRPIMTPLERITWTRTEMLDFVAHHQNAGDPPQE